VPAQAAPAAAPASVSKKGTHGTKPRTIVAEATPGLHPPEGEGFAARMVRDDLTKRVYDPSQLQSGVVLNAAVILTDPRKIPETIKAIEDAGRAAGLPLKAITWQKASGIIGQFVTMMRAVLYTAVLIIFVVALVIINNALVMATLERVREIGTLRAIGAQRRFILQMLVIEALVVGIIFGLAAVVAFIGKIGIPAKNDIFYFFFSGPRLHPAIATTNLIGALSIVMLVSALSGFYPAWLAMRVTPRQAMQSED
jgi:ABC-type lipoprotein release transport system permease subunit